MQVMFPQRMHLLAGWVGCSPWNGHFLIRPATNEPS